MRPFAGLLITAVLLATNSLGAEKGGGFVSEGVTLLRSDASEVAVRVRFPAPELRSLARDGGDWLTELHVPGLPRSRVLGAPSLPFEPVLVTIPPGAEFRLEVDDSFATLLPGLQPAPFELPRIDGQAVIMATDAQPEGPVGPVEISMDGYLRERRVVRLVFYPLTLDAEGGGSVYHPVLTARLVFSGDQTREVFTRHSRERSERRPAGARSGVYEATILNEHRVDDDSYRKSLSEVQQAELAGIGKSSITAPGALLASEMPDSSGPAPAKVPVRQEAIWSVSHGDLLNAGIDASGIASADLALTSGGSTVPLRVIDGGDGTFDAGDRVEFYGAGISGEIEYETNVYRLSFDEGSGTPPATRDAAPAGGTTPISFLDTRRFEENLNFFTTTSDSDGDRLGWEKIQGGSGGTATASYSFTLPDVDPAAATIRIRARLYHLGGSHTTSILLNGVDLMDSRSWSSDDVTHDATTAASNLVPATNTLTLQLSGSAYNQVNFNWFEVEYPRLYRAEADTLAFTADLSAPVLHQVGGFTAPDIVVYDVTNPAAPVLLQNAQVSGSAGDYTLSFTDTLGGSRRFITRAGAATPGDEILPDNPSSLADPANGADLIILAYREFLDELAPLVAARQAEGYRVALVDLEDVYDEFAFGRPDPSAIKAFLTQAYFNWQPPAPAYLLLVGNATLDPKQQLPGSVPPLMPTGTFIAPTLGLAASDNALATLAGDDPLPELFVGRIPAQTETQVADAVAKLLAYESVSPALLNQQVLLVSDNDELQFETIQEDLVSLYLSATEIPADRAYLGNLGTAGTNQRIRNKIDEGALLTNYVGHGNVHNWAAENVWVDTSDIPLLTNSDRPTFVTTLNCINGFHAGPRDSTLTALDEEFVLAPNGGAIGAWGPSALANVLDYQAMSEILFRQLFVDREQTLGVATTVAKVEAFTNAGVSSANLHEMHYFGDPTLVLRVDGDLDDLTDLEEDQTGLDARDADSDDDGILDGSESSPMTDYDGDGAVNASDHDSDDDGLPDGLESGLTTAPLATDTSRGHFVADTDPTSTTDAWNADHDGGGAPDGAEDRNVNGQVDPGETDPQNPADDPTCATQVPLEVTDLATTKNGIDVELSWNDQIAQDPCVLYRIYVATGIERPTDFTAFEFAGTSTQPTWRHPGAGSDSQSYFYLVKATSPPNGDGPLGHYGQ